MDVIFVSKTVTETNWATISSVYLELKATSHSLLYIYMLIDCKSLEGKFKHNDKISPLEGKLQIPIPGLD